MRAEEPAVQRLARVAQGILEVVERVLVKTKRRHRRTRQLLHTSDERRHKRREQRRALRVFELTKLRDDAERGDRRLRVARRCARYEVHRHRLKQQRRRAQFRLGERACARRGAVAHSAKAQKRSARVQARRRAGRAGTGRLAVKRFREGRVRVGQEGEQRILPLRLHAWPLAGTSAKLVHHRGQQPSAQAARWARLPKEREHLVQQRGLLRGPRHARQLRQQQLALAA